VLKKPAKVLKMAFCVDGFFRRCRTSDNEAPRPPSIPARRRIRHLANRQPPAVEHGLELAIRKHPGRVQLAGEINMPLSDPRSFADVERVQHQRA
jgi:hypothetical protein